MLHPRVRVFVDGGGNDRRGVERYLSQFPRFHRVHVFEPNPAFHAGYEGSGMVLEKAAIWTENGRFPFYRSRDAREISSSLIRDKLCKTPGGMAPDYHPEPVEVECVDFGEWIETHVCPRHRLTVKLDIEGAEYEVLEKMVADGTIRRVDTLLVEFHQEARRIGRTRHLALLDALKGSGVHLRDWD